MPHLAFETELGTCALAWSDAGLVGFQLPETSKKATLARLCSRVDAGPLASEPPAWVVDATRRITEHLAGRAQDLATIPLDLSRVSDFDAKVYRALQAVGPGTTTTYGDLAKAVGSPGAARAVGRAMATNAIPVVVPCHRVLAKSGDGGFSAYGGLVTKEKLLAREGLALRRQTSLFAAPRTELPFDGELAVRHLTDKDKPFGKHIAKVGPLRLHLKATEGTFAALAESIVYQQLNGKAAATIFGRVCGLYPNGVLEPGRLLRTKDADLRGAGLSAGKLASLRDLAERAERGEIPTIAELGKMDDDAIVERLTAVRGIGRWTVEMLLIFRLGRPDVLPVADYGIKKGFAKIFRTKDGELATPEELVKRGERWRPFRSVASWYLWRALDAT